MSPGRQETQETLFDGSAYSYSGDDKLDCAFPLFLPSDLPQWLTFVRDLDDHHRSIGMPQDPFLIVQPSLNDSVLVKQGLVEETTMPSPTHIARDIQVRFVCGSSSVDMDG
jgi:hypothetical protein